MVMVIHNASAIIVVILRSRLMLQKNILRKYCIYLNMR